MLWTCAYYSMITEDLSFGCHWQAEEVVVEDEDDDDDDDDENDDDEGKLL